MIRVALFYEFMKGLDLALIGAFEGPVRKSVNCAQQQNQYYLFEM